MKSELIGQLLITSICCVQAALYVPNKSNSVILTHHQGDVKILNAVNNNFIKAQNKKLKLPSSKDYAKLSLTIASLVYGSNYVFAKRLQFHFEPSVVTFIRFLIGSMCYLPLLVRYRGNIKVLFGSLQIGFWCGMGFLSQAYTIERTTASKAAFYCGMGSILPPIFDVVNDWLQRWVGNINYRRSISNSNPFVAPLLALCGTIALEWGGVDTPQFSDLVLLTTPFSFAMCFWVADAHSKKYPNEALVTAGTSDLLVAVIAFVWAATTKAIDVSPNGLCKLMSSIWFDKMILLEFLYSGIVATAMTGFVEQTAMQLLSASEVALIYSLEPLFATAFATIFLHERLRLCTMIGAFFILMACSSEFLFPIVISHCYMILDKWKSK